jgi:SprT protein
MRERKRLLTTQVELAVEKYINMANKHFDVRLAMPEINFSLGGATTAGQAWGGGWLVKFHMGYLRENKDDYIKRTVPHEVAHLVAFKIWTIFGGRLTSSGIKWDSNKKWQKIKPHGKEWKYVMEEVFGLPSSRCHSYKKPVGYIANVFEYACNCKTYELSIIRHRRALKGSGYRCNKCKQPLVFKEEV